ncbi:MAG: NAD(P)H-hydrate epimerase, partial [Spirochaetota bacterium]
MHPAEVAVFDRNAVELGLPISELMEAAAAALAAAAVRMLSKTGRGPHSQTVCFLCGPGNNGGDGYAAALILKEQGYAVEIIATAARQHSEEAETFRQRCQKKIPHYLSDDMDSFHSNYALLVDCLLGAGFNGTALRGPIDRLLERLRPLQEQQKLPPILACDMPSGLQANVSSQYHDNLKFPLRASQTLTFHAPKLSMYCGTELCPEVGELEIAPLPWPPKTTDCGPGEILRFP